VRQFPADHAQGMRRRQHPVSGPDVPVLRVDQVPDRVLVAKDVVRQVEECLAARPHQCPAPVTPKVPTQLRCTDSAGSSVVKSSFLKGAGLASTLSSVITDPRRTSSSLLWPESPGSSRRVLPWSGFLRQCGEGPPAVPPASLCAKSSASVSSFSVLLGRLPSSLSDLAPPPGAFLPRSLSVET
jgi:hypothetical protein